MMTERGRGHGSRQTGVFAVEFAIVSLVFFLIMVAIFAWARLLYVWNTASEATAAAARTAVVCSDVSSAPKMEVLRRLPSIPDGKIVIEYRRPEGSEFVREVQVRLDGVEFLTFIPFLSKYLVLPAFTTTLPRESLSNAYNRPICVS
jgi:hypothetical protein